ncbi:ABC transporter permease [Paenibacillus gansuensis]|uniref:ABC transporter permease n=1 Tax=Paenibacillus gansuensis TaxID=306542 RepID=A0ABW5PD79_9BACL
MNKSFVLRQLAASLLTVFLAMILTFVLLRLTPGSAIDAWARGYAAQYNVTLEKAYEQVALMINYNPKEPIYEQFITYVSGLLKGNLGYSMVSQSVSVNEIIASALPWTLFVSSIALFISFTIGIFLGVQMAWRRKSLLEPIVSVYSILTNAVPDFIFAILLLIVFSYGLGWFPINGAYDPFLDVGFNLDFIVSVFYYAALPILTFVIAMIGDWALSMKGSAVSVIGEDYVEAARARGLPDSVIMKKYVRKNAIIPLVTQMAMALGGMLGGAILVENLFQYPGMGYYMGNAVGQRDYTVMQGILLFIAVTMVFANLIADLIYSKLDPRIKTGG